MATLQQVLALAKRGVPVFPLRPGTKDGYLNNASDHGATTDTFKLFDTFRGQDLNFGCWTADRLVIIDIDAGKGGIEAWDALLKEIGPLPRTLTVRSARGGLHVYFKSDGELFSSADLVKGKINVRGQNGYVVGPGSSFVDPATGTTGFYSIVEDCPVVSVPDALRQRLRLRAAAGTEGPKVASELDTPGAIAQARERLAWAPGAVQGESGDQQTYNLACALLDYGLTEDTCFQLMWELWNQKCSPPWPDEGDKSLRQKVQNAWNYKQQAIGRDNPGEGFTPVPPHMLRACSTVSIVGAPAPQQDRKLLKYADDVSLQEIRYRQSQAIVQGLIHPGELIVLVGKPGSGKSFLAQDMGWMIAQGRVWHGQCTKQAPVLFVCFEGVGGFDKRMLAAKQAHGDPGKYFARLNVSVTLNTTDDGKSGAATIIQAYEELAAAAGAQSPGVIVIDTKSRATPGDDENSAGDTMLFIEQRVGEITRATGAAVLVVHHPNKDGDIRGSSALEGAADVLMRALKGDEDGHGKNGAARSLKSTKVKDGEEGHLFSYNLDVVQFGTDANGAPMTSCVVKSLMKGAISGREQQCADLTKKMMHDAIARGENLSPKPQANKNAAGWLAKNQPAGADFNKAEFTAALRLTPLLGLRVTSYTNNGKLSERYELIQGLPDALPTHKPSDASGACPTLPARCVGGKNA